MKRIHATNALLAVALNLIIALPSARAAVQTWTGGGADNNWSTGGNWGGTAPALSGDTLVFNGTTQQNNTNDFSNLSVGSVTFNNDGFVLNGNAFTLANTAPSVVANLAGTNIIANNITSIGNGKFWYIAPGSEVRLTGVLTNTAISAAAPGWLCVTNGGTVRVMNSAKSANRGMDIWNGTVIVDGNSALLQSDNDGFRFRPPTGATALMVLTNNGAIRLGGSGNFRLGNNSTAGGAAAAAGSLSRMDMSSGTLELFGSAANIFVGDLVADATGVFNQNGGLVWGSSGSGNTVTIGNTANADGTYNLNGGILWISQVKQGNAGATNATFNFNGGTLKPTGSSTTFMQGLLNANILSGGAIIDTTNLNITIGQSLAGTGGLTKLGAGTLTLSGYSSYTGPTLVSNGALTLEAGSLVGGGAMTVADGAMLNITNSGSSLSVSSLTMGSASTTDLQFNFPYGNSGSATITAGTLTGNGSIAIHIAGSSLTAGTFPLINFTSGNGLANFHLASIPPGVSATLVTTASSIALNITSVGKDLAWSGATDGNWDTSTVNWFDLGNGYNPTTYSQSGGFGDLVTFDDSLTANPNINLTTAVSPVSITLNNNGSLYTFTGPGKITGIGNVVKNGFQSVTFETANDYSGGTLVNAGNLYIGADQALGTGPATITFGAIASDSTTPRTLSNPVVQKADTGVILGDTVNTGTLTLAGGLDLGGGAGRTLNFNSDVIISGSLTNGGLTTKTGPGAMILKGNSTQSALASQQQGDVIVDGGAFTSANGWRLQNSFAGSALRLAVTNGGVFNVTVGGSTGNLRVGLTGGDNSANNIVDIAGTLNLAPTSGNVNGNNAVSLGQSGANDILYLRNGGLLITRALFGLSPGNAEAHFMGGTMRAIANAPGFIAGLTNAFMEDGGLTVDTTNFSVTISQPLLASGNGGLTKIGSGTLTLSGADTYTGTTTVNAGKLVLGAAHAATGGIMVNANSTLAFLQTTALESGQVASVTIGSGTNSALEAQLAATNAPATVITSLTLNGSVAVNVSGPVAVGEFPLFGYGTISGPGSLTIGQLPQGTISHLATNTTAKTIDLVVSSIAPTIWTGVANGNWDTTTTNWTSIGAPVAFAQLDNVLFNDMTGNPTVTLTANVTPSSVIVSNNALSYTLSGTGSSLSGSMGLTKYGTNSLTIGMTGGNSFSGDVNINAGTIVLGSGNGGSLGSGTIYVNNGGALDMNGDAVGGETQVIVIQGSGMNGAGALQNNSVTLNNDASYSIIMTNDATIGVIAGGTMGIRTSTDSQLGLVGNGHNLTKVGGGQLNLNGGETVAGLTNIWFGDINNIDVQAGILGFQRRAALGHGTITVESGAALLVFSLDQTLPVPTNHIVMNNGAFQGTGAVGDINTLGGQITLNGASNAINVVQWVGTSGQTSLNLNGPIVGAGGVQFSAPNTVIQLAGNNTYAGDTLVASGTLTLMHGGALAGTVDISISSNATLDVSSIAPWTLGAGQTLGGSGTVNGSVLANGTLAPGSGTGTLTINGDLTLHGNVLIQVNKSLAQPNDMASVSAALSNTGSGSILVSNIGPALVVGDTFTLFNQPVSGSGTMTITGSGATWQNNLAVDGSIKVLSVTAGPTSPEPLTAVASGGNLNLSWPTIGWRLQVQTNSLTTGLNTNWTDVPNSTTINSMSVPVSTGDPTVFFRLVYP